MNGLEFCRNIQNLPIRKIMLTGRADTKLAVEAFNQKIIDKFLLKDVAEEIENTIYDALIEEQKVYFEKLSSSLPARCFQENKSS